MRVPHFPTELPTRLCVQTKATRFSSGDGDWSEPRPAVVEDLIAAVRELPAEAQATIVGALGIVPSDFAKRLERAEWVFDALNDAQLAIDRFREFRKQFPEKRAGEIVDAEFPEV